MKSEKQNPVIHDATTGVWTDLESVHKYTWEAKNRDLDIEDKEAGKKNLNKNVTQDFSKRKVIMEEMITNDNLIQTKKNLNKSYIDDADLSQIVNNNDAGIWSES